MNKTEEDNGFYEDVEPVLSNNEVDSIQPESNIVTNELLDAAVKYHKLGLSVLPVENCNKFPALPEWKKYQKEQPTLEDVKKWFSQPNITGIAIVTGEISGLSILDVEKEGLEQLKNLNIPETVCAKSGGGGKHIYFKYSKKINTSVGILEKMDIRSEGGLIIAPPSKHKSGGQYEWINSFEINKLAEPPKWLLKTGNKDKKPPLKQEVIKEGERHNNAVRWTAKFLHQCKTPKEYDVKAWENLKRWNKKYCSPPLEESELRKVYDSVKKSYFEDKCSDDEALSGEKGLSQKDFIELLLLRTEPFKDQFNEAYVKAEINDSFKILRCKSEAFAEYVGLLHWKEEGIALSSEQIKKITQNISAIAKYDAKQIDLYTRVAEKDGEYYYDLSNDKSEVIKINTVGWEILSEAPILFKEYQSQKAQIKPKEKEGDIKLVLKYLNIKTKEDQLLFLVYLVSCFIPDIPHPIGIVHGLKGSAKSTLSKVVKTIVDPSALEIATFPKDEENLVQILDHHWVAYFDNLTRLKEWGSDALCRAVTGGGLSKRKHYTDDDDKIYNFKRCVGLNGINLVANKPDLLDRSITFELEPIPDDRRLSEKEFWNGFNKDLPFILGGVLDMLASMKKIYPTIKLAKKPRMADFAEHGCAIAIALGFPQGDFERSYQNNRKEQNEAVLNDDIVASSVIKFMEDKDEWIGNASDLYSKLSELNDKKIKGFPSAPNRLSNQLRTVKLDLETCGIEINFIKDCKGFRGRGIEIKKTTNSSSPSLQQPANEINDDPTKETLSDDLYDGIEW